MSWWVTFYVNRIVIDNEQLPIIVTGRQKYHPVLFDSIRSQGAVQPENPRWSLLKLQMPFSDAKCRMPGGFSELYPFTWNFIAPDPPLYCGAFAASAPESSTLDQAVIYRAGLLEGVVRGKKLTASKNAKKKIANKT